MASRLRSDLPADDPLSTREGRGAFEQLVQDVIRRAASMGLSGFFATEEAVRRAFNDVVPSDWVDYVNRQGDDVRRELADRLAAEFAQWLREADLPDLLGRFLEEHEVETTVTIRARKARTSDRTPSS